MDGLHGELLICDSAVGMADILGGQGFPGLGVMVEGRGGFAKKEFSLGCAWNDELARMHQETSEVSQQYIIPSPSSTVLPPCAVSLLLWRPLWRLFPRL